VVAVGVGGAAVDEGEEGKIFLFEAAGRIDQHAFDGGAIVGLPAVGLALGEIAFGEEMVEGSYGARLTQFIGAVRQVDFSRLLQ